MDASVIELAQVYGVLTRKMAAGLLGISEPHASRLLRGAARRGKLVSHRLRVQRLGRPEEGYMMHQARGLRPNVTHAFRIAWFLMAVQAALPPGGIELLFVRHFDLGELSPDAVFLLQGAKSRAGFALEVDTGSESLSSSLNSTRTLLKKIEAYVRLLQQGAASTVGNWFGVKLTGLRLLLVLPGWTRARHLRQLVGEHRPELDFVWMTTFADFEVKNILREPIWELLGSGTRRALMAGRDGTSGQALAARAPSERR